MKAPTRHYNKHTICRVNLDSYPELLVVATCSETAIDLYRDVVVSTDDALDEFDKSWEAGEVDVEELGIVAEVRSTTTMYKVR